MENNFANFIHDMVEDITNKIQSANERMLLHDIIMIYNNEFENYVEYCNVMNNENKRIEEFDRNMSSGESCVFHSKHTILTLDSYKFIIKLRGVYNETK